MNFSIDEKDLLPLGTRVFIPYHGTVSQDEILGYLVRIVSTEKGPISVVTDYILNQANLRRGRLEGFWKSSEFCLDRDEAKELSRVYDLGIITDAEWETALGVDRMGRRHKLDADQCELTTCCATISNIRDILLDARTNGEIDGVEHRDLKILLGAHEPLPDGEFPTLAKILHQMELEWKAETNEP